MVYKLFMTKEIIMKKTYEEVKAILSNSKRYELRDHAFSDIEYSWHGDDDNLIAEGYRGNDGTSFMMCDESFESEDSPKTSELFKLGKLAGVTRNDNMDDDVEDDDDYDDFDDDYQD